MNQRLSNAPTTHRTRSLREKESAFAMNVARRQEHQASTALKVSAILVWLSPPQAHWRELSQWIMGGLRQMSEQQLVDCDMVDSACDSGLMGNGW